MIGYQYQKMNHSNLVKAFKKTDEIIKEVSLEKEAHMIDPSQQLSGKSIYFKDHVHTTDKGSYQLAQIIAEDLFNIIRNND